MSAMNLAVSGEYSSSEANASPFAVQSTRGAAAIASLNVLERTFAHLYQSATLRLAYLKEWCKIHLQECWGR